MGYHLVPLPPSDFLTVSINTRIGGRASKRPKRLASSLAVGFFSRRPSFRIKQQQLCSQPLLVSLYERYTERCTSSFTDLFSLLCFLYFVCLKVLRLESVTSDMPFADFDGVNGHNHYQSLKRPADNEFVHTNVKHVHQNAYSFEALQESAQYLLDRVKIRPKIGIICGSGMGANEQNELCPGSLAESLEDKQCFPYAEIPHFPVSTVKGHTGQMVFGYLQGVPVMCMQGRFHYYEGYPLWKCAMPVRVMKLVGVTHLIATNAAGGLNPTYKVGDIMMVKDHVNMMGFAGNNPLQGPNDDRFGPRFPPMNKAYDLKLLELGQEVAEEMGISDIVHRGVYTCLGGPNFETVAELKMLRMVGVDAVGMSTVHEVITARHCDLTVFAFSLITNQCVTDYENHLEANHEEVMDVGKARQSLLQDYVARMVLRLRDMLKLETK